MALNSSSVKRTQEVMVCQLCETNKNIRVKCLDCELLMCDQCENKTHSKFKNADSHTVVPLSDIGLNVENGNREFKPIKCRAHTKQVCCMYCNNCEKLICPKCISSEHKEHDLTDINTVCWSHIDQLADCQKQTINDVASYIKKLEKLRQMEEIKYVEIRQKILNEELKAKEAIGERYASQLDSLQNVKQKNEKLILAKIERITKNKNYIDGQQEEVEENLKIGDPVKILDSSRIARNNLKGISNMTVSNEYKVKSFYYVQGQLSFQSSSNVSHFDPELKTLASYKTATHARTLTYDKRGFLWTSNATNIAQLDPSKNLTIVKEFFPQMEVIEMKCTRDDKILITSGCKLLRVLPDGKIKTFKDLSPLRPFTLHVTRQNDIVIGMDLRIYNDTTDKPILMKLTSVGNIKREYLNLTKSLLLNNVVRSCSNFKDETVCYIDSDWDTCGNDRLVKLNVKGEIEWTYSGTAFMNTKDKPFEPIEVLCTEADNCLISDSCNGTYGFFHILSMSGTLLSAIDSTLLNILTPDVMIKDQINHLWIADKDNIVHSIKFSGF